ncbi:muconolactone Delta-isomerase family protein [Kitasatospora sp. NPDC006697]|uniref:muconolactone Delta-isomerase family protein n=1 Tax=Kitasatospora sp. NPDC006697 TaxID=3364020 RepID=UPI00367CB391
MSTPVKLAIVYCSSTGTIAEIAKELHDAAAKAGAQVRLLKAAELAPAGAIESSPAWAAHHAATWDVPEASAEDIEWADAVIFGSPSRFGNVAAQLKQFIDGLGGLWAQGRPAGKVYGGFVSSATAHGGQESTLLALYNSVHHFGGILVTPGFTDPAKFVLTTTVPAGTDPAEAVRAAELARAGHLGRLWRPVGELRSIGLWRAVDEAELRAELLSTLPLWPWTAAAVTAVHPHPDDPGRSGGAP